jgi:hypothetical protein
MIGHNGYSFDDVVAENLERGVYWAQRDALIRIIRDPAMSNRHEIVLAEIVAMTNTETGSCYPGRRHLSEATGYTEGTIATTIKELVAAGYIVSTRKAPEPGARALAHYAVVKPTADELRAAVDAHIAAIRASNTRAKEPSERWPKVKPVIHLRNPDVDPVVHVNGSEVNPAIHVNEAKVKPVVHVNEPEKGLCSKADVNPVLPTVTSIISSTTSNSRARGERGAGREDDAKATRLKPDWYLPEPWGRWALENLHITRDQIYTEAESFADYWHGKSGKDARKTNWEATWRNWLRNSRAKYRHRKINKSIAPDLLATSPSTQRTIDEREADERRLAADGWIIPNQGVTRE